MMFNKYLIIARHDTNIRDNSQLAALLRSVDLTKSVVRSEGVYDVLDHTTATMGFGGKLALDLTSTTSSSNKEMTLKYKKEDSVIYSEELVAEWSTLVIFAPSSFNSSEIDVSGVNFVVIFDILAQSSTHYDMVWLAAANTDPRRDIKITDSGVMVIDARSKEPKKSGNPARFPNVVTATPETIELVDSRWEEYKIGEKLESPSRHYRKLLLSNKEDW